MEALTAFLHASFWLAALKIGFLAFLAFASFALFATLSPPRPPGATRYTPLRFFFFVAFLAVFAYQARWQIFGYTDSDFVKFQRRYNHRENAAELQIQRGPILDCRGLVLAAPVDNDVWGRRYPLGPAAVHPLGYFHSKYGITAVERVFDPRLSGYDVDVDAKSLKDILLKPRAKEGNAVRLTLDSRLQKHGYELLAGRKGAVVVLVPATGQILALVSSPGFNPLTPEDALQDTENQSAFNRAVQGLYPPGSTFKLLIAAAALDHNLEPVLACPGGGYIAGPHTPPIRDSEYYAFLRRGEAWQGWGEMTLGNAIVHSSNVYFAQLGVRLGIMTFNEMAIKSQIDKPLVYLHGNSGDLQTQAGCMPDVTQRRSLAQLCIGQGKMLVTPLHVACYTAGIANNGLMMQPQLDAEAAAQPMSRLCTAKTALRVKGFMAEVVTRGTARSLNLPQIEVCGKTGTAQAPQGDDHAWFTCFAPRKSPKIAITVLIENGGFGALAALPVARELLLDCARSGYLMP